jgi:hypothetical protein
MTLEENLADKKVLVILKSVKTQLDSAKLNGASNHRRDRLRQSIMWDLSYLKDKYSEDILFRDFYEKDKKRYDLIISVLGKAEIDYDCTL